MLIDLGNPLANLAVQITDSTGALADATTVTLTITKPDATTVTPAVTHDAVGKYSSSYTPTVTGRYAAYWVATGTNACAWTQIYDVIAQTATSIINIDDAVEFLRLNQVAVPTQFLPRLQAFLPALTPVIEYIVGPVLPKNLDEYYDGGVTQILLNYAPVVSITSVKEAGGAGFVRTLTEQSPDTAGSLDAYGYSIDRETGTLIRRISGLAAPFLPGKRNVHVVYVAGNTDIQPNVIEGALELLRVNWQPQSGGQRTFLGPGSIGAEPAEAAQMVMGYFVPNRVIEMLAPSRHVWGIA